MTTQTTNLVSGAIYKLITVEFRFRFNIIHIDVHEMHEFFGMKCVMRIVIWQFRFHN